MLWLTKPPVLRWLAAASVIVAALTWDLASRRTVPFPYATVDVHRGAPITPEVIEWRSVPAGSMQQPDFDGAAAAVAIPAGDPITRATVRPTSGIPADWWSVPLDLTTDLAVGAAVRAVLPDGSLVDGLVAVPATRDTFGVVAPGAVAFPPGAAEVVGAASLGGEIVIVTRP